MSKTNYKNSKAFSKFVNGTVKSSAKNRIETLTDDSGNSFSSHARKVKILHSHYTKLDSELDAYNHGRRKHLFKSRFEAIYLSWIDHIQIDCWISQ